MPVCDPNMSVVGSSGISVISVQCKCIRKELTEDINDGQPGSQNGTFTPETPQATSPVQQDPASPPSEQQTTASDADAEASAASPTASPPPDCVETQWLAQNGLENGIHEQMGIADVLCPPHFPCGTPGHLLRWCLPNGQCSLVSYAQICGTYDCAQRRVPVSRLRHSFDWFVVQHHKEDGSRIEMTSVSVGANDASFSLSYGVAYVGHYLSTHGYGHMCDYIVNAHRRLRPALMWWKKSGSCSSSLFGLLEAKGLNENVFSV